MRVGARTSLGASLSGPHGGLGFGGLLCFLTCLLAGCYYGSPNSAPVVGMLVNPEDAAEFYSDDKVVHVTVEKGTVSRPTQFSITRIPQANYPDQSGLYGLVSDVYLIEPARPLNKQVRVVFDISGKKDGDFSLVKVAGRQALTLRALTPGAVPAYVKTTEPNLAEVQRHILYTETNLLGSYGVYWHECYRMCERASTCPGNPAVTADSTVKSLIDDCMAAHACPADLAAMNGQTLRAAFSCSKTHPCWDSYGCCLEEAGCPMEEADGDLDEDDSDGDSEAELESDTQDREEADTDTEVDSDAELDFSPLTCDPTNASSCAAGTCVTDSHLGSGGFCVSLSATPVAAYTHDGTGYGPAGVEPDLSCVAKTPAVTSATGYVLHVQVDEAWGVDGTYMDVAYYRPASSDGMAVPYTYGRTDGLGGVDLSVSSSEWFVLKLSRGGDATETRLVPTYEWGLYVPRAVAAEAGTTGGSVILRVHPMSEARHLTYTRALGFSQGLPAGLGLLIGEARDCGGAGYTLANVSLGLKEAAPTMWGYLDTTLGSPMPQSGQTATTASGLFVGLALPASKSLTAFAFSRQGGVPVLVGLSAGGAVELEEDSVSFVRFNRTY